MTHLFQASQQWATRPRDERYPTLEALHDAVSYYKNTSATKNVRLGDLRVEAADKDVQLVGKAGVPAKLTHYAFGQFCNRIGAPASYLRQLPPTLAAQNLNHGLATAGRTGDGDKESQLYFHRNGSLVLRAMTGTGYGRVFDADLTARLLILQREMGWTTPPPAWCNDPNDPATRIATEEELKGRRTLVKPGDRVIDAGLYASDHDMFAFLVNESRTVEVAGQVLARGFFLSNSEVGDAKLRLMTFLYDYVCGNHNVWGAQDVCEVEIIHRGKAAEVSGRAFRDMQMTLTKYLDASTADDVRKIVEARSTIIAADKDKVLDKLFGIKSLGLSRKTLGEAYAVAEHRTERYGDPRSVWAVSQSLTEVSQRTPFADERTAVDRAAGRLLDLVF